MREKNAKKDIRAFGNRVANKNPPVDPSMGAGEPTGVAESDRFIKWTTARRFDNIETTETTIRDDGDDQKIDRKPFVDERKINRRRR